MTKRFDHNSPDRPRNARKRSNREARQSHKRIMQQKKDAEKQDAENNSPGSRSTATDNKPQKVFHADHVRDVKKYISRLKQKIDLPFKIEALRKGKITTVIILNKDGKERELLPDKQGVHKILCHGSIARAITSNMCVITKITQNERKVKGNDGNDEYIWIDGSWSIAPCSPEMLTGTTVQHLRKRPFWFLRRYWYEISFDGRVQPGSLFYDYRIDPLTRRLKMYVTHEFIQVRYKDAENDYFRFWLDKKNIE